MLDFQVLPIMHVRASRELQQVDGVKEAKAHLNPLPLPTPLCVGLRHRQAWVKHELLLDQAYR